MARFPQLTQVILRVQEGRSLESSDLIPGLIGGLNNDVGGLFKVDYKLVASFSDRFGSRSGSKVTGSKTAITNCLTVVERNMQM